MLISYPRFWVSITMLAARVCRQFVAMSWCSGWLVFSEEHWGDFAARQTTSWRRAISSMPWGKDSHPESTPHGWCVYSLISLKCPTHYFGGVEGHKETCVCFDISVSLFKRLQLCQVTSVHSVWNSADIISLIWCTNPVIYPVKKMFFGAFLEQVLAYFFYFPSALI